jgi:hypothetical protein
MTLKKRKNTEGVVRHASHPLSIFIKFQID